MISEAMFTFQIKDFMQELIYLIDDFEKVSRKGSFTSLQEETIALLLSNLTSHDWRM